jgi:hypothetical protein
LVRETLTFAGDPVTLVRGPIALISDSIPFGGQPLARQKFGVAARECLLALLDLGCPGIGLARRCRHGFPPANYLSLSTVAAVERNFKRRQTATPTCDAAAAQ